MNCNVPGEVPSIAVQAVSKDLNQHVFYCSKHGRIEIDKALSEQKKELENFKPNKREKRKLPARLPPSSNTKKYTI